MALETPLLRVSRPVAACSRCRTAKVKCDGKLPACTACERSNRAAECSSTNDQFAKGKERSYVATLETRVERLEKKIAEARARRQSSITMQDDTPRVSISVETNGALFPARSTTPKPGSRRAARRKEVSNIDDLVSDFGFLAVNSTARDFYGFTSATSYARLILSAATKEPLPSGVSKVLPPRYAASRLIEEYLRLALPIMPFFDESSFYGNVDAVYHADASKAKAIDLFNVRMVLAISSASLSEQRGDHFYSDAVAHVNEALNYSEQVLHPGSISSIQALLFLMQYSMVDPHHFDSWTLIGAASRMMVDLGLHQNPSKSAGTPRAKVELRRKVFWCIYALDRSTSLVSTRAFSFSDDSANVALPFGNKASSSKSATTEPSLWSKNADLALQYFRIRQIQSDWYTTLFQSGRTADPDAYRYIWKMYREMSEWFTKLPSSIPATLKNFFELELLYSYVYLLSPSPRCPIISKHAQRLIFEHCITYAARFRWLLDTNRKNLKLTTFYDAMKLYMTGRTFVDSLSRNMDILNHPLPRPSNAPSTSPFEPDVDPLAPESDVVPSPLPSLGPPDASGTPSTPVSRAIQAIQDFTNILSSFGVRFGYINWRDRFQRESANLLTQLQQRTMIPQQQRLPTELDQNYAWSDSGYAQSSGSGTSPGVNMSSHVSPGATSYYSTSPYMSHQGVSPAASWAGPGSSPAYSQPPVSNPLEQDSAGMQAPMMMMDDFGLNSMTAWETLPGGSLNARFS